MSATLDEARAAKALLAALLADRPEVTGVGVARGGEGWVLHVALAHTGPLELPESVDGVPVTSSVVGRVRARE